MLNESKAVESRKTVGRSLTTIHGVTGVNALGPRLTEANCLEVFQMASRS